MKKFKLNKESRIGLTVIIAIALFVWGLNYLKGINLLKQAQRYYVVYNQIDGLVTSAPVMLDGFQVGLVKSIDYQYNSPGHILVELNLEKQLNLPVGTKAVLEPALVGNPNISLILGPGPRLLAVGDTLTADRKADLMIMLEEELIPGIKDLIQRAGRVVSQLEAQLDEGGDLNKSLASVRKTSERLASASASLDLLLANEIPSTIGNINSLSSNFNALGRELRTVDFAGISHRVDSTLLILQDVSLRLTRPDNSLGLLLNDTELYFNLNKTASSANELLLDLRERPKRYVHFSLFGSKK
ncbi:MAG: MCE family protein [Bacteroidales bacterium]|jgi:phospholipid/cholesterol/gamma-HCH transport system substrate-binding protein|nr:MCE family protein [Bacteroidales bacterium]HOH23990.1 MlaD family protein [Bacteroidales bacterium]HPL06781.1 MlaD family protein [Bacteroidales bacterium]